MNIGAKPGRNYSAWNFLMSNRKYKYCFSRKLFLPREIYIRYTNIYFGRYAHVIVRLLKNGIEYMRVLDLCLHMKKVRLAVPLQKDILENLTIEVEFKGIEKIRMEEISFPVPNPDIINQEEYIEE